MNKKSTKRALLSSVLSLVLCMAMLVGTTFAWFTDSVTSTGNRIKSGTLQVDLLMDKNETGNADDYVSIADGNGDIFSEAAGNGILWEPGKTEIVYLAVANEGNLALKYNIVLDITDNGLAGALEYAIIAGAKATDLAAATKWADVETYTGAQVGDMPTGRQVAAPNGKLEENGIDYFALAVHMKEEAGNEYQEKDIVIDVQVQATQATVEEDSFDNQYDKDAFYADATYNVTAANFAETWEKIENKDDKIVVINLEGDVEWETGAAHGSTPFVSENAVVEKVFMNGNGYTFTATGSGVGPVRMANGAQFIVDDLNVVDKSVSYAEGSWEFTYLEIEGNSTYNNCTFNSGIMTAGNMVFNNCSFTSNAASEYSVWVDGGNATFNNCQFTGTRALKMHEDYGTEIASVVVDNCKFGPLSKKPGVAIGDLNADTEVVIKNSTFLNCQEGDQGKYIYESDTDVTTFTFTEENNTIINNVSVTSQDEINAALSEGKDIVFTKDIEASLSKTAIYGTPVAIIQDKGAVIDGNGCSLDIKNPQYDGYAIETYGGTIKNLTIDSTVGRGIVISLPKEDIYIDNVIVDGPGYAINTTEHNGKKLIVTNSTIKGWTSLAGLDSVSFTKCAFGENTSKYWQNMGYDQDYDRLVRPYVTATFTDCEFEKGYYIDLSELKAGCTLTITNCAVNGVVLTETNYSQYITIELPSGRTLSDCVAFN